MGYKCEGYLYDSINCKRGIHITGAVAADVAFKKLATVKKVGISVGTYADDIGNLGLRLQMIKVKGRGFYEFDGYGTGEEGIFIVQLGKGGDVDHAVCVEILRRLIFDSEEDYRVALTEVSVRLFAGGSGKSRIGEVRQLDDCGSKHVKHE